MFINPLTFYTSIEVSVMINWHMLCVLVDGTVIAVEQENIVHDEACVEDQEPDIHVPQPVLYIHPKAEMTSYDAEQTETN